MTALAYRGFDLPWVSSAEEQGRLRNIMLVVLWASLLLGVVMPWIPVPKAERQQVHSLPPRLAQLVLEQQKPPVVPPKPEPRSEEKPKPEPKPQDKPKPEPKPKQQAQPKPAEVPKPKVEAKPEPQQDKLSAAREKAASAGLLAFADDLAELRDEPAVASLNSAQPLVKSQANEARIDRSVLTTGTTGSGGIKTAKLSAGVVGSTELAGRQSTRVESRVKAAPGATATSVAASDKPTTRTSR